MHSRANRIISVKNYDNIPVYDWHDIGQCFTNLYEDLFSSDHDPLFHNNLNYFFPSIISNQTNEEICSIPTHTEIKNTLFSFASHKSPRPDGFPPLFYKSFWKTARNAIIAAVQNFYKNDFLLKSLNHTFMALIRKSTKLLLLISLGL